MNKKPYLNISSIPQVYGCSMSYYELISFIRNNLEKQYDDIFYRLEKTYTKLTDELGKTTGLFPPIDLLEQSFTDLKNETNRLKNANSLTLADIHSLELKTKTFETTIQKFIEDINSANDYINTLNEKLSENYIVMSNISDQRLNVIKIISECNLLLTQLKELLDEQTEKLRTASGNANLNRSELEKLKSGGATNTAIYQNKYISNDGTLQVMLPDNTTPYRFISDGYTTYEYADKGNKLKVTITVKPNYYMYKGRELYPINSSFSLKYPVAGMVFNLKPAVNESFINDIKNYFDRFDTTRMITTQSENNETIYTPRACKFTILAFGDIKVTATNEKCKIKVNNRQPLDITLECSTDYKTDKDDPDFIKNANYALFGFAIYFEIPLKPQIEQGEEHEQTTN